MKNELNVYNMLGNDIVNYFEDAIDTVMDYKEMLLCYDCAIKEIETKFNILNAEFQAKHKRNPISTIKSRLKSNVSIINKVNKLNVDTTVESIKENIEDIAGVRVICNYLDDIYVIYKSLVGQDDIELIKVKDYISNPKPNGYRSLHLIVRVPVFFANSVEKVKVEVQIRTIAMDFWATLEHQMRYKKTELDSANHIIEDLTRCANIIANTDEKMQQIRKDIEDLQSINDNNQILLEKIRKLNISLL